MANRVVVTICGEEYTFVAEESTAYTQKVAAYVDEKMDSVMKKFEKTEAWNLPVVEKDRTYVGFVSKSKIFSAYRDQLKQVSHD